MESAEERKQNNRKDDEKRQSDSEIDAPSKEKEWDPTKSDDHDKEISDQEKLKSLKGVRIPNDDKQKNIQKRNKNEK